MEKFRKVIRTSKQSIVEVVHEPHFYGKCRRSKQSQLIMLFRTRKDCIFSILPKDVCRLIAKWVYYGVSSLESDAQAYFEHVLSIIDKF